MAGGSDSFKEKVVGAPVVASYGRSARQGKRSDAPSAPPCVTLGQLLRGSLLMLAIVAYANAPRLKDWLPPLAPQAAETGVDTTPVAAIRAARTSAELPSR
jgi:hypothetical protein